MTEIIKSMLLILIVLNPFLLIIYLIDIVKKQTVELCHWSSELLQLKWSCVVWKSGFHEYNLGKISHRRGRKSQR